MLGWSKYIGRRVRIIYWDLQGRWTMRTVIPHELGEGWIKAHCCERGAPRLFRLDRIMAAQLEQGTGRKKASHAAGTMRRDAIAR